VTVATPLCSIAILIWLVRTDFNRASVVVSFSVLPVLIWFAASRVELGVTILVETPIVWLLSRMLQLGAWRAAAVCCFVNALTQPLLYLVMISGPVAAGAWWWPRFIGAELAVWLAEAALYLACLRRLRRSPGRLAKALGISLAANGASAVLGLLLPI
jgi:hypothetical protein